MDKLACHRAQEKEKITCLELVQKEGVSMWPCSRDAVLQGYQCKGTFLHCTVYRVPGVWAPMPWHMRELHTRERRRNSEDCGASEMQEEMHQA